MVKKGLFCFSKSLLVLYSDPYAINEKSFIFSSFFSRGVSNKLIRSNVSGISHTTGGDATNVLVSGSGNSIDGNNNFMWGASNTLTNVNNAEVGGFSNIIQKSGSNSNTYGAVVVGWNNTLGDSSSSTA